MSAYASAVTAGDCASAGIYVVGGTDSNCEERPDHYQAPGHFGIGRIIEVDQHRVNVELLYQCASDCTSEQSGFVRAVESDGRWSIDYSYNHGSYIGDEEALAGGG